MSDSIISSFFDDPSFSLPGTPEDIFSIFDALDGLKEAAVAAKTVACGGATAEEDTTTTTPRSSSSSGQFMFQELSETELDALEAELASNNDDEQPKSKRAKIVISEDRESGQEGGDGSNNNNNNNNNNKISHITVERNRRKQMNEHLSVLRSLMPCFYVKRGDQASIIGGVVEYINELQHILQSLEAKKQRKVYSEVLSPRVASSPRTTTQHQVLSPRKPPLSPRLNLPPISPRTPQPSSPYRPRPITISSSMAASPPIDLSPSSSSSSLHDCIANNELVANSSSPMAEVEVKFAGPNLLLKTASTRIPGQVLKIISTLEDLSLEILHINISTIEDTMLNSFTIKIGIECQLSAEELAHHIQQTFCVTPLLNYS